MADQDLPDAPWAAPSADAAPSKGPELEDAPWAAPKRVAYTPGQKVNAADQELLDKYQGSVPDAVKSGAWSFGNTAALYAPRALTAAYTSYVEDQPYKEALKEQTEYENALYRQHPTAAHVGTGLGLAATLATPLGPLAELGEAANIATTARLGSTAGKAAEAATIGGTLSGVSGILATADPHEALKEAAMGAGLGAVAGPALGALGNYFTKLPAVVDASGNLVPEAQHAIDVAFKGKMSDSDIDSFKNELVNSFQSKGISPEAAREALLTKEGITPTASLTTGKAAPAAASDIAEQAVAQGKQALGERAESIMGQVPDRTAVAEDLARKTEGAVTEAGNLYESMKDMPGVGKEVFGPLQPGQTRRIEDTFIPNIQQALANAKRPTSFENVGDKSYPQAKAALEWMESGPGMGNFPYMEGLTPRNMQQIMKDLNGYAASAKGDDYYAVKAIKEGFLQSLRDNLINPSLFSGDGAAVVKGIQDAPAAWSSMKATYFPKGSDDAAAFRRTVNNFVDGATKRISADPSQGMLDTAQSVINSSLLSPKIGSAYYERLEAALGANSPEMNTVKQHIKALALNTDGDLAALPKKIDSFLSNSPTVAKRVFDQPGELAQLRRLSEAVKIINAKPISQQQKTSMVVGAIKQLTKLSTSGLIGFALGSVPGAVKGIAAAKTAEAVGTPISSLLARSAETAGAPKAYTKAPQALRVLNQAPSTSAIGANVNALLPVGVPGYQEPTTLPPLTIHRAPVARASGGRVAAKLVSDVERAKKAVNDDTKAFLHADDSHVARALEIANQNTEG